MANKNYAATITFGGLIGSSFKAATSGVERSLQGVRKEYRAIQKEIQATKAAIKSGTGDLAANTAKLADLERQASGLKGQMSGLAAIAGGQIGGAFRTLGGQVRTLGLSFAALATGAAFAGTKILGDALRRGDEIGETAQYLGITADALQKFRYAASVAGVDVEEFDKLLGKLTVSLSEAADPSSQMGKTLTDLGVSWQTLNKIPAEDRLGVILDRLRGIKATDAERANRILRDLFGKTGIKANLLVDGGSEGLIALGKRAEELNLIIGKKGLDAASDADNAWRDLTLSVKTLGDALGENLLPVFTQWAGELTKWVQSDGYRAFKQFGSDMAAWLNAHKDDIIGFFRDLRDGAVAVGKAIVEVKDAFGGWGNLMKVGLALYLLPTVVAFSSLAANILKSAAALRTLFGVGGAAAGGAAAGGAVAGGAAAAGALATRAALPVIGTALALGGDSPIPTQADIAKNYTGASYKDTLGMFAGMSVQNRLGFWGSLGAFFSTDGFRRTVYDTERARKALASIGVVRNGNENEPLSPGEANAIAGVVAQRGNAFSEGKAFGNVNITINQAPGQSPEAVAQEVIRRLKGDRLSGVALHD